METRFIIEVTNNITGTVKNAYIDHKEGSLGFEARGQAALRVQSTIPISVNEKEKNYIIGCIKNGYFRELEDGARSLPEVITRFGSMVLPYRKVDFTVLVIEVNSNESILDLKVKAIESFTVKGTEGKGKINRHLTKYEIISNDLDHIKLAA